MKTCGNCMFSSLRSEGYREPGNWKWTVTCTKNHSHMDAMWCKDYECRYELSDEERLGHQHWRPEDDDDS